MDLESFTYQATDRKIRKTEIMLMDLLQAAERGELVDAKHLAAVLGSVIALRISRVTIVTTHVQRITAQAGWVGASIWLGLPANVREGSSGRASLAAL